MSNATVTTAALTPATVDQIVARYVAVWSEPDAAARREAIAELWTPDGTEYVEGIQFRGREELEPRIAEAYKEFVESGLFAVASADDVTVHGDVVRFTIQLIAKTGELAGQPAWTAAVLLVIGDDGLIREDYHLTVKPLAV